MTMTTIVNAQQEVTMLTRFFLSTAAALAFIFPAVQASGAQSHTNVATDVKFVSGGVGEQSDSQMQAMARDYNLRLLFAAKDGHYLAGVPVTITSASGATVVDTIAEGPRLFATLPPGTYKITAQYDGKSISRTITIPANSAREEILRWEEPALWHG